MNFDETLAFLAQDEFWDAAVVEGVIKPIAHRAKEFPFHIYFENDGLTAHRYVWQPNHDRRFGYSPAQCVCTEPLGVCVCPPWMPCYCDGRDTRYQLEFYRP